MSLHTGVTAIVFYVHDIERTINFYRDVLGLRVIAGGGTEAGEHLQFARAETGEISLIFFEGEHRPGATPIIVFGVEKEIENVVEELARRGAEIVLPVSEAPGGLTADFRDPDGHILSLYQAVARGTEETP